MGFIIEDGTGDGFKAEVDKENRIRTFSDVRTQIAFVSKIKQQAYVVGTGLFPVPASDGLMFYFRNTSQTREIHISQVFVSFNGGTASSIQTMISTLQAGLTEPTTNTNVLTPRNLNSGSGNLATATVLEWDFVGTGMTGFTPGVTVAQNIFGRGFTQVPFNDALIIQFNDSIGISLNPEVAGTATITMSFYFENVVD